MKSNLKILSVGLLTAISASLCCITPILALLAGTSGLASTFSWIEPFRPYLIGLTVLVLGFAWYQKLKPQKEIDCDCETDEKPKFINSKTFLGIVTVFASVMLAFPYFSSVFYSNTESSVVLTEKSSLETREFKINGMTCGSCEEHVNHEVNKLNGIINSTASFENGNAVVEYDRTQTNETEIEAAINSTGYEVVSPNEE